MALGSLWWTGSQLSRTLAGGWLFRCSPDGALGTRWAGRTAASRGSLDYPVPAPYRRQPRGTMLDRAHARAADPAAWRDLAYLLLLLPVGALGFAVVVASFVAVVGTVTLPAWLFVGFPDGAPLWREVRIDTLPEALIVAVVALPVSTLAAYLLIAGVSRAHAALGKARCWDQARARGSPSGSKS